jgi:heme A synthase
MMRPGRLLAAAVVTLIAQAVLGAITVWTHNAPVTVGLHLALGMILLGLVVAATVRAGMRRPAPGVAWHDRLSSMAARGNLLFGHATAQERQPRLTAGQASKRT